jgi:hypothetical protein
LTHAPERKQLQFLVARLVNPVTLSFSGFSTAKPELHLQIRKKIEGKFE